jgi:hypothetical protein
VLGSVESVSREFLSYKLGLGDLHSYSAKIYRYFAALNWFIISIEILSLKENANVTNPINNDMCPCLFVK